MVLKWQFLIITLVHLCIAEVNILCGIIIYLFFKIVVRATAELWAAMENFQLPSALAAA